MNFPPKENEGLHHTPTPIDGRTYDLNMAILTFLFPQNVVTLGFSFFPKTKILCTSQVPPPGPSLFCRQVAKFRHKNTLLGTHVLVYK